MPITRSIDRDNHLSITTVEGLVSVSEAVDFIRKRAADEKGGGFPVLVDARQADEHRWLITDMDLLARLGAEIYQRSGYRKEAFVVTSEQNAGLLSLFRKYSVNGPNQKVFNDIDAAIDWLKADL